MVTDTYLPKIDGVVVSLCNATKYLSKKGHKIGILAPIMDENYKDKRQKNVKIYRFPAFPFPPYPEVRVSLPSIKKIGDIIKKFKPDIIHTHSPGTLGIAAVGNPHLPHHDLKSDFYETTKQTAVMATVTNPKEQ